MLHRLSPGLITSHHQNNHGGAVKRLNAIRAQLASMALSAAPRFQLNGHKREELVATNSMLLRELQLGSLAGNGATMEPAMKLALVTNHGATAMRLRAAGLNARYLRGGLDGWQAAGRPTQTQGIST
jgi:Fe-Mn family superoxide dismutase